MPKKLFIVLCCAVMLVGTASAWTFTVWLPQAANCEIDGDPAQPLWFTADDGNSPAVEVHANWDCTITGFNWWCWTLGFASPLCEPLCNCQADYDVPQGYSISEGDGSKPGTRQ